MPVKTTISILVAFSMFSNYVFSDCDFRDLKHNSDGTVVYSAQDHICVGNLVQDNKIKSQQVQDLNKAISLKDLAIQKSDQRAQLWQDTSLKLEDNIQKVDQLQKTNEWTWFALGALSIVAAGVAASQVSRIGH